MVDGVEHGQFGVEQLCLVLCEVANLCVVPHLQRPLEGYLAEDTFHEGRFTFSVAPYKRHLLTAADGEVDMGNDFFLPIGLAQVFHNQWEVAAALAGREFQVEGAVIDIIHLDGYNAVQLFDAFLHLYRLGGLVAETLDELLQVGNLLLLILVGPQLLLATFGAELYIFVVLHLIVPYAPARDLERAVGDIVDEGAVVGDEYHSTCPLLQVLLQPLNTVDVEMVGRLVQQ